MTPLLRLFGRRRRPEIAEPLRAELLSIERLEERARALAAGFTLARNPHRKARPFFQRLDDNARVLRAAYRVLADDVHRGEFLPPAAEWLLDNFHLVEGEIRDTRRDLPRDYYRQLPKLASRERAGVARVYAMALELIRHTDGRLDQQRLVRFVAAYQTVREEGAPVSIQARASYAQLFDGDGSLADPAFGLEVAKMAAYAFEQQVPTKPGGGPVSSGNVSHVAAASAAPAGIGRLG